MKWCYVVTIMLLLRAVYIIVIGVIVGKLPRQVKAVLSFPKTSLREKKRQPRRAASFCIGDNYFSGKATADSAASGS